MNERQQAAWHLHLKGHGPAEIGKALGVTRQSAYGLVKRAEANAHAFSNVNPGAKPTRDGISAAPVSPYGGDKPLAIYSERVALDFTNYVGWTMASLNRMYDQVNQGHDSWQYFQFCEEQLERDAHTRHLVDMRSSYVSTLPIVPDKEALPLARDMRKAKEFLEELKTAGLANVRKQTAKVHHYGVVAVGAEWDRSNPERWKLKKLHFCHPKMFLFDRRDPRKMYIRPEKRGGALEEAPAGQYVPVFFGGEPLNPVRAGLARPNGIPYVLKMARERGWATFLDEYGFPASAVTLPDDVRNPAGQEFEAWKKLARDLGPRSTIVMPGGAKAEYLQHSAVQGDSKAFESHIRFQEEKQSRLYSWGSLTSGTSNTGSGGSQALGEVHSRNGYDIMREDAASEAAWINELAYWWNLWNYGDDTPPKFYIEVKEPENLTALWDNALKAQKLGAKVSKKGMAERGGVPFADDEDPEDVLEPMAQPATEPQDPTDEEDEPAQRTAANSACPVHGAKSFARTGAVRDGIDDLVDETLSSDDWETVSLAIDEAIQEVASQSTGFDDLRQKLAAFVESGDVQDLRLFLTQQKAKARLAAAEGLDLTAPSTGSGAKD